MQKIKTAILSYGMSGKVFHAPFLNVHEGYTLVGAWERSKKLIQKDYPDVKSYDNIDDLLNDSIDLVIVNTPVSTHFEYAKKALLAGKHVLVEKAFTTTVAQAQELDSIAKQNQLKLAVFHNRRWDSDFKTVQSILDKNSLGEIVEAEIHFDRYNPLLSPKTHKETVNDGAGILKDLGPHIIDQALVLFGMPKTVFANICITRENSLVDDWFDISLFYKTFSLRLKASFFVREAIAAYVIHGKKGSFLKPRGDVQEDELKLGKIPSSTSWCAEDKMKEGLLHTEINGEIIRKTIATIPGNYYDFFECLYNSIIHDSAVPVSAQEGINVMKIIEKAIESNRTETKIIVE